MDPKPKRQQHMSVWEVGGVNSVFFFSFLLLHVARGLLVPQPRVERAPPVVEVQSLTCWTARELPSGVTSDHVLPGNR